MNIIPYRLIQRDVVGKLPVRPEIAPPNNAPPGHWYAKCQRDGGSIYWVRMDAMSDYDTINQVGSAFVTD